MNSEEFLEMIKNKQINKELEIVGEVQIKNLKRIIEVAKESLENLGMIYDEIKTKEVRDELEMQMNKLGKMIMENEAHLEIIEKITKEIKW